MSYYYKILTVALKGEMVVICYWTDWYDSDWNGFKLFCYYIKLFYVHLCVEVLATVCIFIVCFMFCLEATVLPACETNGKLIFTMTGLYIEAKHDPPSSLHLAWKSDFSKEIGSTICVPQAVMLDSP